MKIIHCADLHLDARMTSILPSEQARLRKRELVQSFLKMIEYAKNNDVESIIIAGDMFDTNNILVMTRNLVWGAILDNPSIDFYYLSGNHDIDNFLSGAEAIPDNLHLFNETWTKYILNETRAGNVVLYGAELTKDNTNELCLSLQPNSADFNIVTLHGQVVGANVKDKAELINIKALKGKSIDYIALGHVHSFKEEEVDGRCTYCYPGCLEGRGFDECGEHGFVLLDIDENSNTYTRTFITNAQRMLFEEEVDVTDVSGTHEVTDILRNFLDNVSIDSKHLVKIVLTGAIDVKTEINTDMIVETLGDRFFFLKIKDETKLKLDTESFVNDASLRGEFIRTVEADDSLSDDDKKAIIRIGLQGFAGEEFE